MNESVKTSRGALDIALAYHRTWSQDAFDRAMAYIAPDIAVQTPAGPLQGGEAFRGFMGQFAATVEATELLAAYGDDARALVVYDTRTPDVPSAPGAELVTVRDGRIRTMRILFDQLPFALAAGEVVPATAHVE